MSGTFDPALKDLLEARLADWLAWLGLPVGPCRWIDANLPVLNTEADKVLRVEGNPTPWLLHLEVQTDHDLTLAPRMHRYFAILQARHNLPVHSVAVLLRKAANASNLTGELRSAAPGGPETVFRYTVVRLWEQPPERILSGGVGVLPLAPLTAVSETELPRVVTALQDRLDTETAIGERRKFLTATYVLMGLSWEQGLIDRLLREVRTMKSSVTYQAILEEGREEGFEKGKVVGEAAGRADEARTILVRLGTKKFGRPPAKRQRAVLDAITDAPRLERLTDRIFDAANWPELLAD